MTVVTFTVIGTPAPQGSKTAFVSQAKGGKPRAIVTEGKGAGAAAHSRWRSDVALAAASEAIELGRALDGALGIDVQFRFRMPTSRPKAVRQHGSCPKTSAPDLDKLVRAVGDALQAGGLIADDARLCVMSTSKIEVADQWTGARIELRELTS